MYVGGDCAQIVPQIWIRHEKRIKFAFLGIFGKLWMRILANRISNLDSTRENDENGLFTCIFRSPDALARILRFGVLFRRHAAMGRQRRGRGQQLGQQLGHCGRPVDPRARRAPAVGTRGSSRLDGAVGTVHAFVALV